MKPAIHGIHHITAISGDPQTTLDFYTDVLGLRFIKKTINFDDPQTYHFYFGDYTGKPGTILTFFPWGQESLKGQRGNGQIIVISFSVPAGSLKYWQNRLNELNIQFEGPFKRFGEEIIAINDNDNFNIELASSENEKRSGWFNGEIPEEHSIRGFHSALLSESNKNKTEQLMINLLGFRKLNQEGNRSRYESGEGGPGTYIDIIENPNGAFGRMGVGIIHHIAFRIANDEEQKKLRVILLDANVNVSEIMDRNYFHSIYFKEPGNVLFEGATDPPGFTIDETLEELGTHLLLPEWYEKYRHDIENVLPKLSLKNEVKR